MKSANICMLPCLSAFFLAFACLAHATEPPVPFPPPAHGPFDQGNQPMNAEHGTTFQVLRGTRVSAEDEQPAPADEPPAWMPDMPQVPSTQTEQVLRTPTRTAPVSPPPLLPVTRYDSMFAAVKAGDFEDVHTHILRGADLEATDEQGKTAVSAAAAAGNEQILELLLDYGANPRSPNSDLDLRPMHLAASNAHWGCVRLLADFGVCYEFGAPVFYGDMDSVKRMLDENPELLTEPVNVRRDTPLHAAVNGGQIEVIEFLASRGAPLSLHNIDEQTPLAFAVRRNCAESVKALAAAGANMNHGMRNDDTVLHQKARKDDTETVALVLSLGGDINAQNHSGATPLHTAAENNSLNMIAFLLEHGANIEAPDNNGQTPLHVAASSGALKSIRALIAQGAKIDAADNQGAQPLHTAAQHASKDALRALVEHGAHMHALNARGASAMHYVVTGAGRRAPGGDAALGITREIRARMRLIRFLADSGASADAHDFIGVTPLHLAAAAGQRALCNVLLERGASVDAKDLTGRTPLIFALERSLTVTAQNLLEAGADIEIADNLGRTPLHVASQTDSRDLVRLMVEFGAHVNAKDEHGRTPLHYAAEKGCARIVRLLLAYGAPIGASDAAGWQALHLAVQREDIYPTDVLVGNGSEVSARDMRGRQPLHIAASEGRHEIAGLLLRGGADPDGTDESGYTPLHVAAEFGHRETARMLIANWANPRAEAGDGRTPVQIAQEKEDGALAAILRTRGGAPAFLRALDRGDVEESERLLSLNRSLVNTRRDGMTALHVASLAGNKELVELLLGYGANVALAQAGGDGATPLHAAAETGNIEITRLLLMMGADTRAQDRNKLTPQDVARQKGHAAVAQAMSEQAEQSPANGRGRELLRLIVAGETDQVRRLLDEYESVVSARFLSLSPVQLATTTGKPEVLALLLERGADPNAVTNHATGRTLLHEAASRGFYEVAKLLVAAGAKTDVNDRAGNTPAESAIENGFEHIAQILNKTAELETE